MVVTIKKNKKIIIPVFIGLIVILSGVLVFLNLRKEETEVKRKFDDKVVSTITIDINPSFKLELNKNNKVISIISLNDDAENIEIKDYKGKDFDKVFDNITKELIEKEYVNEKADILLNIDGKIKEEDVKKVITDSFKSNNINAEIIVPTITDSSKELAKKYNITESKAAYIEQIVKNNTKLKVEDIVESSVKDINNKIESIKEEETKENKTTSTSSNSGSSKYVSAPSDPRDISGAWCAFNKSKASIKYQYSERITIDKARSYAKSFFASISFKGDSLNMVDDKRASYCTSFKFKGYDDSGIYYATVDSVTGAIIDSSTKNLSSISITKESAIQIGLSHFGLDRNNCELVQADPVLEINTESIYYSFIARCGGVSHGSNIDANTGAITNARTW